MKINSVNTVNNNNKADNHQSNPNFKGLMDIPGMAMNGIEKGGFATSFIIQDTLGMTLPRTGEGLQRGINKDRIDATWNVIKAKLTFKEPSEEDKQKCLHLKDLNFKEGLEVGIREGLSGPLMMFTPMLVLALGRKYIGKSTFTNSSMINRLGNRFAEIVKGPHDSVESLRKDFYKKNITNIVQSTTKSGDVLAESAFIERATDAMAKLDEYETKIANSSGKIRRRVKKAQKRAQAQLVQDFNDYHKTYSSDFDMLNRVKFDGQVYSIEKTINGIRGYAKDVLNGKTMEDLSEEYAKRVKKSALIKRGIINASATASTIGSLSIVPMLYKLVNPVPPGALGDPTKENAELNVNKTKSVQSDAVNNSDGQVSFTGKLDKLARNLEFNGNQLTPALMTTLAAGGLMGPRCLTAAKRAPEDNVTHKKDYSEIPEILTRDIISTGAVTFGVPMLSKALISTYENSTGFVLRHKAPKAMSTTKKVLDYLNPFSGLSYYEISDLDQIYGNVNTTEKLGNLAEFVDKNGGSVAKVLGTEKGTHSVFEKYGLNIKELRKQSDRKSANETIINKMNACKDFAQELVEKIKPAKEGAANSMLKRARSYNSYVSFAATVFFVPLFLGFVLPKFVYRMTANRQKKQAEAREAFLAQQGGANNKTENNKIDYSKLRPTTSATFKSMKSHS